MKDLIGIFLFIMTAPIWVAVAIIGYGIKIGLFLLKVIIDQEFDG